MDPGKPEAGATVVTLTVNGRRTEVYATGGRFRDRVVLNAGRNRISASAEVMFFDMPLPGEEEPGETRDSIFTGPSEPVHVTRRPDRTFGRLDLATALLVAEGHSDVYWLCGEADGCLRQQVCVRVGERRVDCPVRYRFKDGEPITCGVVISVHLRGRRLFSYSYGCRGRWSAQHNRFVRRDIYRKGRQYRIDERGAPWVRSEMTDANRYGIPRFDIDRDVFIP